MNRLDEIEARANAATEGPWEEGERCVFTLDGASVVSDDVIHYVHGMAGEGVCHGEDAEFIAHARTDVPALVAALRAVLKVHARLTHPFYAQDVCAHPSCTDQDDHMDQAPYPCPTVAAIRQHLGEDV